MLFPPLAFFGGIVKLNQEEDKRLLDEEPLFGIVSLERRGTMQPGLSRSQLDALRKENTFFGRLNYTASLASMFYKAAITRFVPRNIAACLFS